MQDPPMSQSDQLGLAHRPRSRSATTDSEDHPSVNVCVRVRPLNKSEAAHGQTQVVFCDLDKPGHLQLLGPGSGNSSGSRKSEAFMFDTVLPTSAGQSAVYNLLGSPVVQAVADGYHGCIFAYGQTGSGKSYTIFGGKGDTQGLIHRIADGLFQELDAQGGDYIVKMSNMEVYNEQARDLLHPIDVVSAGDSVAHKMPSLEVREHPQVGVFVDGLTRNAVESAADIERLVDFGHKIRVMGSTNMNATSSRSHAIVTLHVERVLDTAADTMSTAGGLRIRRHAQLHVVDLAGSERMVHAGDNATRQQESRQINKSLLALGQMIARLAVRSQGGSSSAHIPYRDSKLTFLLSQSLMGNCRTAMLACISPSSENYRLTESTLRFAASVKKIRTRPVRNEEIEGDLVRSLRAKIEVLEKRLHDSEIHGSAAGDLQDQIRSEQYLQEQHGSNFAEHKAKSKAAENKRRQTLHLLGLATEQNGQEHSFYIANVCDDPLLSGRLSWGLSEGQSLTIGSDSSCDVRVDGLGIEPVMCTLRCSEPRKLEVVLGNKPSPRVSRCSSDGSALRKSWASGNINVTVNGELLQSSMILNSRDLLMVGRTNRFKVLAAEASVDGSHPEDSLAMHGTNGRILAKDFAERLRGRFGQVRANRVLKDLQDLKFLVDEANDLTDELKTEEEYDIVFKEYIMMDPAEGEEVPSLVVAMRQVERPEDVGVNGPVFTANDSCRIETVATWTVAEFKQRLEVMHDLYDEVRRRNVPWGQRGDLDPWQVIKHIPSCKIPNDLHSPPSTSSLHDSGAGVMPRVLETELRSTTEHRPLSGGGGGPPPSEREEPDAEPADAERRRDFALILQELAKAHAARDLQAGELASVRRELEELRSAIARSTAPRSPARRPGDNSSMYSSLAGQSPVNLASQFQATPERIEPPARDSHEAVQESSDPDAAAATLEQPSLAKPSSQTGVPSPPGLSLVGHAPASGCNTPRDKRAQIPPPSTHASAEGSHACKGAVPRAWTSSTSPAPVMVVAGGKAKETGKEESTSSPSAFACGMSSVLQEPPGSEDRRSRTASAGITCMSHASLPESEGAGSFLLAKPPEGLFPPGWNPSVRSSPASGVLRQSSAPAFPGTLGSMQAPSQRLPPTLLLPSPRAAPLTHPHGQQQQHQCASLAVPLQSPNSCSNALAPDGGSGRPMSMEPVTGAACRLWPHAPSVLTTSGILQPAAADGGGAAVCGRGLSAIPLHVPQLEQRILQSMQLARTQPGFQMQQPMQRNSRSSSPMQRANGHVFLRAPSPPVMSSPTAAGQLQRSHSAEATMSSRLQHSSGAITPPASLQVAATMFSRPQHGSGSITPPASQSVSAGTAQVSGSGTSLARHPVHLEPISTAAAAAAAAHDAASAIAAAAAQAAQTASLPMAPVSLPSNSMFRPVSPRREALSQHLKQTTARVRAPWQTQTWPGGESNATAEDLKFVAEIERSDSAWKMDVQSELEKLKKEVDSLGEMYKDLTCY
eukprot:TRINITY_DN23111_c0_g1_i1.p1 TRINITY_DN23111_c0_g1~~TRINITY_DN23111_c0_g1_i1.p1  ORF type:complete len:1639 (+),score=285.77 TRINITY_DN23111_c0_g1_i1:427-4917(+)